MQEKYSVGQNIHSYCGKCKLSLDHTVLTVDGETVGKVKCRTCGGSHKYRTAPLPQKVAKPRIKKAAGATTEMSWEAGLAAAKGKECDYNIAAKYAVGDVVSHQTFGKGIVTKVYSNKCDMLFKDKERLMASANK